MNQHASLSAGRWSAFSFDQQILMIGNEMIQRVLPATLGDSAVISIDDGSVPMPRSEKADKGL